MMVIWLLFALGFVGFVGFLFLLALDYVNEYMGDIDYYLFKIDHNKNK